VSRIGTRHFRQRSTTQARSVRRRGLGPRRP